MLDLLPDLSGQPPWVVVVVVALFIAGTVGTAWIRRRSPGADGSAEEDEQPDGARPPVDGPAPAALTTGGQEATLAIRQALDLLASEASESNSARAEAERWRSQLEVCSQQREEAERRLVASEAETARLRSQLDECNAECRRLARRALGLEGGQE